MNLQLADKVALITGASSGIGAATAQMLAEESADIVVVYGQDRDGAERCAHTVESYGRLMRRGASIVTVGSVSAHTGAPHHIHYAAAKAGLINLTKSLARTLAPDIRVNCVAPGITLTPMEKETVAALPPNYAVNKPLVQRFATPEEIARCIVFVSSPITSFMTGVTVDINGVREIR